jgi:hypothetical protein
MKEKYKAGENIAFTPIPNPPDNTSGHVGHLDDLDGLFIEWLPDKQFKIVLRKDGIDYKQGFDEFINNCK